ncbi:MAG: hypothetical protein ACR2P3_00510 [Geminicoccaceae bacterium]
MVDRGLDLLRATLERIPKRTRQSAISTLGMLALISPLFLWVTWSFLSFRIVLYGAVSAIFFIYLLIWSSPDDDL